MTPAESLQAWLAPLASGSGGAGVDARYDDRHDRVRQEVAKLETPLGSDVDWPAVVREGGELLAKESKDFLIASYVCGALLESEGPAGLATGLELLCGLMERYWEAMHPPAKRARARGAALQWALDRIAMRLGDVAELDSSTLEALIKGLERLREQAQAHLPEHPPAFQPSLDACARIAPTSSAPTADAQVVASSAPNASSAPAASEVESTPVAPAEEKSPVGETGPAESSSNEHPLLKPIHPDKPAGDDARYDDPVHDELRAAIKQLSSPTGEAPNWSAIAEKGSTLLKERSKDLLIATYVAEAWRVQRGLRGLIDGLSLLSGLLERFHADLYPDRSRGDRARGRALAWYFQRLERLSDMPLSDDAHAHLDGLDAQWKALEQAIANHVDPDHRPALGPVREQLTRLKLNAPQAAPKPQPAPAQAPPAQGQAPVGRPAPAPSPAPKPTAPPRQQPPSSSSTGEPAALAVPPDLNDNHAVNTFMLAARGAILELAHALRAHEPDGARAFRLLRSAAYLRFFALPPVGDQGRTLVQFAIPEQRLQSLLSEGRHEELLELCEHEVAKAPLCLDFHYYAWAALDALGRSEAKQAVTAATQGLVHALPGLLDLEAADGRPFAGDLCKAWLSQHGAAPSSPAVTAPTPEIKNAGDDSELLAAEDLIQAGKLAEGIQAFQAYIDRAKAGRSRFLARMAMAEAVNRAKSSVALALYAGLLEDMDAQGLEAWEPELAARCLAGYFSALRKAGKSDTAMAATASVVYRRLCRLDPVRGLKASE